LRPFDFFFVRFFTRPGNVTAGCTAIGFGPTVPLM